MEIFRLLFNICAKILNIHMNLLGYSVSLFEVLMFTFVVGILGAFIFGLFD